MLKYLMLLGVLLVNHALAKQAWADSFSHTRFQHRKFSTSSEASTHGQFSTSFSGFNSPASEPQTHSFTPQNLTIGSSSEFSRPDFHASDSDFSPQDSRFSNMRMEFHDPEFSHRNFNVD